jgi:O-acetylhomoserine/O-acetylserine sulfhydrylase-like pyridoxal-dependent enzyme
VVVDNTYCTPYLQQPLLLGADVSVHSMTKYLGGHGDLTAGAAIFADAELAQRVRLYGLKDMTGAVMSAQDAHLVMRGLKTLALRMDRHCQSAQKVAEFIAAHPAAAAVHYPGLPSFAQHALAKQQMRQMGGMIAFELQGWPAGGRALHGRAAARHPRREPGRCRNPGPAPGQHDAFDLHARAARRPRHCRRAGAPVGGAGRPGRAGSNTSTEK